MEFVNLAIKFAYGSDVDLDKVAAIQTLSGTGACRIGGEFYSRFLPKGTKIFIPEPTWGNHIAIYKNCGLDVQRYRYYDYATNVSILSDTSPTIFITFILSHQLSHECQFLLMLRESILCMNLKKSFEAGFGF